MSEHTVPTPPPEQADAQRVAALIAALPAWHRANIYGPVCPPTVRTLHTPRTNINPKVRAYVYARDNRTCQGCNTGPLITTTERVGLLSGRPYITLDHHVIEWRNGGCDHAHNLRVLCSTCNPRIGNTGPAADQRRADAVILKRSRRVGQR